jgi:hypothetical protein
VIPGNGCAGKALNGHTLHTGTPRGVALGNWQSKTLELALDLAI